MWRYPVVYTEATLNVILAGLLDRRCLRGLGEVKKHISRKVRKPDVLLTVNLVKVIIEGKFKTPGAHHSLEEKCLKRIEEGLCDIAVAVVYPHLTLSTLSPTHAELERELLKAKLETFIAYVSHPEVKKLGWQTGITVDHLAELVLTGYTAVVSEDILGEAVESLRSALNQASEKFAASVNIEVLGEKIKEVMEIPEGEVEPEEL